MTYFVKLLCVTISPQYTLTERIIDQQFFTKSTEKNRTLISLDRLLNWAFIPSGQFKPVIFFFLSHKYTTVTSYNIFEKIKPPNLKTLWKLIVPMCKLHSSSQELLLEAILTVSGHKDFILRACSSNCVSNDNGFPLRSLFIPSPRAPPCDQWPPVLRQLVVIIKIHI